MFKILWYVQMNLSNKCSLIWDNAKVPLLKSTAWMLLCAPYCQSSALSEFMAALDLVTLPACFSIYLLYACVIDYDFHNSFTQTHSPHKTELEHWGKKSKPSNGAWLPSCSEYGHHSFEIMYTKAPWFIFGLSAFYPVRSGLNIDMCCCIQYLLILHFRSFLRLPFKCNWASQRPLM